MPTNTLQPSQAKHAAPRSEPSLLGPRLSTLAARVIDYARAAKVQRFRYCRQPLAPSSPHPSLQAALSALESDLAEALDRPICQSSAAEFLKDLAALTHQPPCQNRPEQLQAARIIDTALLQLR